MTLEEELTTYKQNSHKLLSDGLEGRFALVQGERIVDTFATYEDAVRTGYREFGLAKRFLVRQILRSERVFVFTRDIIGLGPCF